MNTGGIGGGTIIPTIEFLIKVQQGRVPGHSILAKFAENPDIASGSPADIWDFPSVLLYTFSTSAAIDSISSSDAGDSVLIVMQGLDDDWNEITQTKVLDGRNRVALDTPMRRIHSAFNGNGIDLLGNVYIYENTALNLGVPVDSTKVRAYIALAEQNTLMGIYTVPAGKTGYFMGLTSSISRQPVAANCIFTGKARPFEKVFRTQIRHNMSTTGTSYVDVVPTVFSPFPEKTDFVAHGNVSANGIGVSLTFNLLLIDN